MASYNKVFLMGNLTRDPQVKHLPSQMVVVEFGLAVNRKYKTADGADKEEVAFVDCTAFGRQAETISQYCTKGKPIFVEGRLKYDQWDDKQGGGKRSTLTVTVDDSVAAYCVALATATRDHQHSLLGASPRGSLALMLVGRGHAVLRGRDYLTPEDVKAVATPVLAHRITVKPELWMSNVTGRSVVDSVLATVPTP